MVMQAWSVDRVRAAEGAAMALLPEGELMARASRGLAAVLAARVEDLEVEAPARVAVLAGPGGNGGDALFAAAYLLDEVADAEATVDVVAVLVAGRGHEPAMEAAREAGIRIIDATDTGGLGLAREAVVEADVVVDGILGIGGRPDLSAGGDTTSYELVSVIPDTAYVLAVDLPSGTDPSGTVAQHACVFADETVTFSLLKGVHLGAGEDACGMVTVVDIGIDEFGLIGDPNETDTNKTGDAARADAERRRAVAEVDPVPVFERLRFDDVPALWPVPGPHDHKYSRGVLGVVAGGENYTGAPLLTCTAAVEAGAGMVRYVGPKGPSALIRSQVPEAVLGAGRVQAWVVGPGLDPEPADEDEAGRAQVAAAKEALASDLPCVVDAGGLDLLDGPREAAGARTLLTPHAGELARLLMRLDVGEPGQVTRDAVEAEPLRHARRAAELLHATVLLKGHRTLVVPPGAGRSVRSQADAPSWLATAGSGDVLAGLVGALLAAGLDPPGAGALAALVHGVAGDDANPGGPVRALSVARAIPRTVARLLTRRGEP